MHVCKAVAAQPLKQRAANHAAAPGDQYACRFIHIDQTFSNALGVVNGGLTQAGRQARIRKRPARRM